jgi:hypothetical protein
VSKGVSTGLLLFTFGDEGKRPVLSISLENKNVVETVATTRQASLLRAAISLCPKNRVELVILRIIQSWEVRSDFKVRQFYDGRTCRRGFGSIIATPKQKFLLKTLNQNV